MNMIYKIIWMFFTCVFIFICTSDKVIAFTQKDSQITSISSNTVQDKINNVVDAYVSNHTFEGTILVSKSGKTIFQRSYGFSDRTVKKSIKTDTPFPLSSLSKPITATLIMQLVEQGKLTLNDTLAMYFPQFNNPHGKQITLHHLLSNTSGIPNHFSIPGWFSTDFHNNTSHHDFITLISQQPLSFQPGDKYLYSNPGYYLLGKIVEKVTKLSFSKNLEKHIFMPLNMNKSGVAHGSTLNSALPKGYRWQQLGGYRQQESMNMKFFGAGASIFSNVNDLLKFDLALYNNTLVNEESKEQIFNSDEPYGWELGLIPIKENKRVKIQTYNGQIEGYSSMLTRLIDNKHSIILLSNIGVSYTIKQQFTLDIASVLYGEKPPNRTKDATLKLINSIVLGNFGSELKKITSNVETFDLNEESLTRLAFQLLWSGISDYSLQLFSFIKLELSDSNNAKSNLLLACNHRQAKHSEIKTVICKK
jgi:CubicO group peptidase (beta-lactamase class C family)